jgi:hypothetical protein
MVCQQLDELEWDFIQARAESPDIDSLGWTDREFSCLDAILEHKREGQTVNAVLHVAQSNVEVNVTDAPPLVRSDSSELDTTLDSRCLTELPLPSRFP